MKRGFVLDENVIIGASQGKNERGEDDLSFEILIKEILDNCHHLDVDYPLHGRYMRQVNRFTFPRLFKAIIGNADKYEFGEPGHVLDEEDQFHHKDVELVRLAVARGAILVTTDGDLHDELVAISVTNKYELLVVRPEEALTFAGPVEE